MTIPSNIIGRDSWRMPGPLGPALDVDKLEGWVVHHTAMRPGSAAAVDARRVAQVGIDRFGLASYSYFQHPSEPDSVFLMQGLRRGAHTARRNSRLLAMAFHGYYHPPVNQTVDDRQLEAAAIAIAKLHVAYGTPLTVGGHRDFGDTACPGDLLYPYVEALEQRARQIVDRGSVEDPPEQLVPPPAEGWRWPRHVEQLRRVGVYSDATSPGVTVDTDLLSAYLDRMRQHYEHRIDQLAAKLDVLEP